MEERSAKREDDGSISTDRISELPQPLLYQILSFLSQKEAIQTCILSRSWRYIGSTRPKIEFLEDCFNGNTEKFLSALDETLRRYQNLPVQEFIVWMWVLDSESVSLLNKWIPILVLNKGLQTFHLCFHSQQSEYFDLPSVVLHSESLENLHLERCNLKKNSVDGVVPMRLRTLCLVEVYISTEIFEKILSGCPLIENVSVSGCWGLRTIKVGKPCNNLKHFEFKDGYELYKEEDPHLSIWIDSPTIRTIRIMGCRNFYRHRNNCLPHLKSLFLNRVQLSSESFVFFSSNYLPSLECLTLDSCYGFKECYLYLSDSVKYLTIKNLKKKTDIKADIHAPKIVEFVYEGEIPNLTVSFKTYSIYWKSNIILSSYSDFDNDPSSWFSKLGDLLMALSESETSLKLVHHRRRNQHNIKDVPLALLSPDVLCEPVVAVEHLVLRGYFSSSSFPALLNLLFRTCHPKYIGTYLYANAATEWEREDKELNECLRDFLLLKKEMKQCFWLQDLEEVSVVEASDDENIVQNYHPDKNKKVCFRLRWRELR
ncbi:hypothetical protein OROHE_011501 [Orobanche hederae]